jgi:hypothetical protein
VSCDTPSFVVAPAEQGVAAPHLRQVAQIVDQLRFLAGANEFLGPGCATIAVAAWLTEAGRFGMLRTIGIPAPKYPLQ